ncbi:hypothetical protein D3C80_1912700 [compost metagenome]
MQFWCFVHGLNPLSQFAVLAWRYTEMFFEQLVEMEIILVADALHDFLDRQLRVCEQLAGQLQTLGSHIV